MSSFNPAASGIFTPVGPASRIGGNVVTGRNIPPPLDNSLPPTDPKQTFNDCRTINGWMQTIKKIIDLTWVKEIEQTEPGAKIRFTHDYALLPENPQEIAGVIVVYETLSKMPAKFHDQTGGHREVKPRVRQTWNPNIATWNSNTADAVNLPSGIPFSKSVLQTQANVTVTWAQSFDVVQMFTVYGDTWDRMYEYLEKFEKLMTIYSRIFIQGGLQQMWFQQSTRDSAYDPDRLQEFPSKTLFYFARIEEHKIEKVGAIQQVLIDLGITEDIQKPPGVYLQSVARGSANTTAPLLIFPTVPPVNQTTISSSSIGGSGNASTGSGTTVIAPNPQTYLQFPVQNGTTTWVLNHNLNGIPDVITIDSAGQEMIGDVTWPTLNQVIVTFSVPVAGVAYLYI